MSIRCQVVFCEQELLKHHHAVTEIAAILEDHKRFASQHEANEFFQRTCRELEKVPDWLLVELLAALEKVPEPKAIVLGKG